MRERPVDGGRKSEGERKKERTVGAKRERSRQGSPLSLRECDLAGLRVDARDWLASSACSTLCQAKKQRNSETAKQHFESFDSALGHLCLCIARSPTRSLFGSHSTRILCPCNTTHICNLTLSYFFQYRRVVNNF